MRHTIAVMKSGRANTLIGFLPKRQQISVTRMLLHARSKTLFGHLRHSKQESLVLHLVIYTVPVIKIQDECSAVRCCDLLVADVPSSSWPSVLYK